MVIKDITTSQLPQLKKTIEKKLRVAFFKKDFKNRLTFCQTKKKIEKRLKYIKIINEKGNTTNSMEIQRIIRDYYE